MNEHAKKLKTTPFTQSHIELGAKMHEFAGYNMPIEYPTGIIVEHMTVLQDVGVFDVSHMGEFWVKGEKALPFLQKITSNDVSTLTVGKAQYSCFVNDEGGIVDDFIIYHYSDDKYLLVVNAANIEKDWNWCVKHNTEGAILENNSDGMAQLAVQGPKAKALLQGLTEVNLDDIPYYSFKEGTIAGADHVIISNTGYTGAGGFELYFYPEYGERIWKTLFKAGEAYGLKPIGLGARDTLRLEMGFCLYGNDIDMTTTPLEAGLGWITKLNDKKLNMIGRDVLLKEKETGLKQKLICFVMKEKGIPRQGYDIVNANNEKIGRVTSGTMSPSLKIGIGMGYVKPEFPALGSEIYISVRDRRLKAEVVKPPFRKQS